MLHARLRVVVAAKSAGTAVYDTPYHNIRDLKGLEKAVLESKQLGFTGMAAIHPSHVAAINTHFGPSPAQLQQAVAIVQGFIQSSREGRASLKINNQMVD